MAKKIIKLFLTFSSKLIIGQYFIFFNTLQVQAEITETKYKGVGELLTSDYQHLSPFSGFKFLKSEGLKNYYNRGNPHDSTIQLIKFMFYSPDGINYLHSIRPDKMVKYFTSKTIGEVIGQIEGYDSKNRNQISTNLTTIMSKDINFQEIIQLRKKNLKTEDPQFVELYKETKKISDELDKKNNYLSLQKKQITSDYNKTLVQSQPAVCSTDTLNPINLSQIEKLNVYLNNNSKFAKIKEEIDDLEKQLDQKQNKLNQFIIKPLVDLILNASEEAQDPHSTYSGHFVSQIFLALFGDLANNSKDEFLKLLQGFPKKAINQSHEIFDEKSPIHQEWINQNYSSKDFQSFVHSIKSKSYQDQLKIIHSNPHDAQFYAYMQDHWGEISIPQDAPWGYSRLNGDENKKFPNCGEQATRNFFDIVIYDPVNKVFDISLLTSRQDKVKRNMKVNSELISFYQDHPQIAGRSAPNLHDRWGWKVMSHQEGVNYIERNGLEKCEMNVGVDNQLKVLQKLLFPNHQEFEKLPKDQKWDFICKKVSRKNGKPPFILDWAVKGALKDQNKQALLQANDKNVTLEFTINGKLAFEWVFMPAHFLLNTYETKNSDWRAPIATELANSVMQAKDVNPDLQMIPSFISSKNLKSLFIKFNEKENKISSKDLYHLIYQSPLDSFDAKLEAIKLSFQTKAPQSHFINTLISELPENDAHTQTEILKSSLIEIPFSDSKKENEFKELQQSIQNRAYKVLSQSENQRAFSWSMIPYNKHKLLNLQLQSLPDETGVTPIHFDFKKSFGYSNNFIDSDKFKNNKQVLNHLTVEQLKKVLTSPFGESKDKKDQILLNLLSKDMDLETLKMILDKIGPEIFLDLSGHVSNKSALHAFLLDSNKTQIMEILSRFDESLQKKIAPQVILVSGYKGGNLLHYYLNSYSTEKNDILEWIKNHVDSEVWKKSFQQLDNENQTVYHLAKKNNRDWIKKQISPSEQSNLLSQVDQLGKTPIHLALGNGRDSYNPYSIKSSNYLDKKNLFSKLNSEQLKKVLMTPFGQSKDRINLRLLDELVQDLDLDTLKMILNKTGPEIFLDSNDSISEKSSLYQYLKFSKSPQILEILSRCDEITQKKIASQMITVQDNNGKILLHHYLNSYDLEKVHVLDWIKSHTDPAVWNKSFYSLDHTGKNVLHDSKKEHKSWVKDQLPLLEYQTLLSQTDELGQTPIHVTFKKYSYNSSYSIDDFNFKQNKYLLNDLTSDQIKKVLLSPFGESKDRKNQTLIDSLIYVMDSETLKIILDKTGTDVFLNSNKNLFGEFVFLKFLEYSNLNDLNLFFSHVKEPEQLKLIQEMLKVQDSSGKNVLERLETRYNHNMVDLIKSKAYPK